MVHSEFSFKTEFCDLDAKQEIGNCAKICQQNLIIGSSGNRVITRTIASMK